MTQSSSPQRSLDSTPWELKGGIDLALLVGNVFKSTLNFRPCQIAIRTSGRISCQQKIRLDAVLKTEAPLTPIEWPPFTYSAGRTYPVRSPYFAFSEIWFRRSFLVFSSGPAAIQNVFKCSLDPAAQFRSG